MQRKLCGACWSTSSADWVYTASRRPATPRITPQPSSWSGSGCGVKGVLSRISGSKGHGAASISTPCYTGSGADRGKEKDRGLTQGRGFRLGPTRRCTTSPPAGGSTKPKGYDREARSERERGAAHQCFRMLILTTGRGEVSTCNSHHRVKRSIECSYHVWPLSLHP